MPRLKVIDPATTTGRVREIFEGPLKGKHLNIFKGLANAPAALDAYLALSHALSSGSLSPVERELIALSIGEANQCGYCVAAHTMIAKGAGLSEADTIAARKGSLPSNPRGDALVKFVLRLHEKKGWVSEPDLASMRKAGFNDGHIAEAIACYSLSIFTNYFNHVNESVVDFPPAPALK